MRKDALYLSTIASDAASVARRWGLGVELAQFCTAWNMDERFSETDREVQETRQGIANITLHGPFNELFPCAIDKKARELAALRYGQAIDLAKRYGAKKVILHGGYNPWIYYPEWYVSESTVFWKDFLSKRDDNVTVVLENVLETEPQWLVDIVRGVDDPRLRLCLDIGHVNAYSKVPLTDWLALWAPYVGHFHIHNNDGSEDRHGGLREGNIPMKEFLLRAEELCPAATYTLELLQAEPSVQWLIENGLL
ncbi:MAG: sugar phosphate isomerase/epimerase [Oscillospiraceae bacterium]|nr:sugar phosphate isomerase/epimerase [Oscillospiraceae bacterium]